MTPEKRLDQLELVVADTAQKVDRLIETNGQILDVAVSGDANAKLSAKGVANLTINVNEFRQETRESFERIDQNFAHRSQQIEQINQIVGAASQQIEQINQNAGEMSQQIRRIDEKIDTETGSLRVKVNNRFDQLITLIQELLN